ncbi:MAG: DUF4854 domain-containing protein [Oscillospiraceae bacterium]|nr:DUF4854 domain-containing protein [Oscillospiraceae bacterium]
MARKILAMFLVTASLIAFTACAAKTAEDFATELVASADYAAMLSQVEAAGLSMTVSGEGDTLTYSCTYLEEVDHDMAREHLDTQDATLEDAARDFISAMNMYGIKEPKVVYIYLNQDGSQIWSRTYS